MKRPPDNNLTAPAAAVVALAVCCGAPLAVALLLTTGLGAALLAQGWLLAGLALLAIGLVLGLRYVVRVKPRAGAGDAAAGDCCAPTTEDRKKETIA